MTLPCRCQAAVTVALGAGTLLAALTIAQPLPSGTALAWRAPCCWCPPCAA